MKIVHICLCGPVTDGWTYQDNLLSKYHKKNGNDVDLITSQFIWDDNGQIVKFSKTDYINEEGVRIIRIPSRMGTTIESKIRLYKGLYDALERCAPEVLFIHGVQFPGISTVKRYLKHHRDVRVYADNHADFSNSATNWLSKNILHKILWRHYAKKIEPFVTKFYGVLPARVDFLADVYGIRRDKIELLVMGADDENIEMISDPWIRTGIREKLGLAEDDFVVMTGGKIDAFKTQTLLLMEAVAKIDDPRVKLVVFGSVSPDLKERVDALIVENKVKYIGWVEAKDSYAHFAASDLVVFPGRHSVFWEQVVAQGIPMLVKFWDGTTHVDCGGNVKFLRKDSAEEIKDNIEQLVFTEQYSQMMEAANKAKTSFLYSDIAKRSIGQE